MNVNMHHQIMRMRAVSLLMRADIHTPRHTNQLARIARNRSCTGGRFIFGFGPSGPQVSEGWYGVPYAKPWGRTREYIEVVREIVARRGPLQHSGEHYQLPIEGGTGQGKALKLNFHPLRNDRTTAVSAEALLRFARDTGHEPVILEIPERAAP